MAPFKPSAKALDIERRNERITRMIDVACIYILQLKDKPIDEASIDAEYEDIRRRYPASRYEEFWEIWQIDCRKRA